VLLFLVRRGLFVNRVAVFVLHFCSLEHPVALLLLARCLVIIARLAVDFRLVVVGIEDARVRVIFHINDRFIRGEQNIAQLGTARTKKSHDDQ